MTSSSEGRSPVSYSMEVTGLVSPQGTMSEKKSRSVVTLRAKPWEVTPREMWTPMAAILRSELRGWREEEDASSPHMPTEGICGPPELSVDPAFEASFSSSPKGV